MSTFGENLKNLRKQQNISQGEFARLIQTPQQRVSEWECNKVEPSLYNIIIILNVFNVTFEELTEDLKK